MTNKVKPRNNTAAEVEKKPVDNLLAEYGTLQLEREALVAQLQTLNNQMNATRAKMAKQKEVQNGSLG